MTEKLNKFYTKEEVDVIAGNSNNELLKLMCTFDTSKVRDPECIHYSTHYEKFFKPLRDKPIRLLEIGVKEGQSLKFWRKYFHNPKTEIFGIEINPEPLKGFSEENTKIFYGSQSDEAFLQRVVDEIKEVDIIIDDGSHQIQDQITSFEFLFKQVLAPTGIYVIEDLGPSYWPNGYKNAGYRVEGTAIEYLKDMIDSINYRAWKGDRKSFVGYPEWKNIEDSVSYFEKHIVSLYTARSIAFVEKGSNFSV